MRQAKARRSFHGPLTTVSHPRLRQHEAAPGSLAKQPPRAANDDVGLAPPPSPNQRERVLAALQDLTRTGR